jgi:hypothetical protein
MKNVPMLPSGSSFTMTLISDVKVSSSQDLTFTQDLTFLENAGFFTGFLFPDQSAARPEVRVI